MKPLLTFSLLLTATVGQAQITIGQADMPSAGDTMRYQNDTPTNFDAGDTGPGHIWDFSMLVPQGEGADTAVTVASTPLLYQFFFNNPFIYPDWDADYAMKGTSIDFPQLQIEDLFDYYKKGGSAFSNVGFGATINGLPSSVQRNPVDHIFRFPMNYGNVDSSFSTWNVSVPTILYFGEEQWRHNTVDGWGTLYLPADTFEVLRVESRISRSDTIYVDQFGIGFQLPVIETIEYKWVAQGRDAPVLTITTLAGNPVSARFYQDPTSIASGVNTLNKGDRSLRVMPNPADQLAWVSLPADAVSAQLLDAEGRAVLAVPTTGRQGNVAFDVSGLASGLYTLQVTGRSEVRTVRLSVQH